MLPKWSIIRLMQYFCVILLSTLLKNMFIGFVGGFMLGMIWHSNDKKEKLEQESQKKEDNQ